MEYCEFLECIKKQIARRTGDNVYINHVVKNNGYELDGIVIMEEGNNISPNIYLNHFYNEYKNGVTIDDITQDILRLYNENKNKIVIDSKFFSDFDNLRSCIVYKVINYERNKQLLEQIPHKKILDMAVVYYCLIEQFEDMSATALIYNTHMYSWKVTESDIYRAAYENTPKLLNFSIQSMASLFMEKIKTDELCDVTYDDLKGLEENDMFVLTNESRLNGASCMLYDNVLKEFADSVESDLYILPSSIHEVILLPKREIYNINDLKSMVHEVNTEEVSPDEVLSDQVYTYDRANGMLTM